MVHIWLSSLFVLSLLGCSAPAEPATAPELFGIHIQASSITTPDAADAAMDRVETGRFTDIFVNLFAYGHAYYDSTLLETHPDVADDFNPLAYLIDRAHGQGIRVHAWLVAGPVGYDGPGPILSEHPEWAMMGTDGQKSGWLNYTRPDVRAFLGDVVVELAQNYGLDGVYFDYTRYSSTRWGFDPYSARQYVQTYDEDLDFLRYPDLPAYGTFAGNPLIWPHTALVLAEFDNGQPAILINEYGLGQAILLNWDASEREVVAGSEILDRSIDHLLGPGGRLHVLRSRTNAAKYGSGIYRQSLGWLEDLGHQPETVLESEISGLSAGDVLVLPQVYLLADETASNLEAFVRQGGNLIFIDGPTPSIWNRDVRAITGMRLRGRHFREGRLLLATREHAIIPNSSRTLPLDAYRALDTEWKDFRKEGISQLLREIHQRLEAQAPDIVLGISVASDQEILREHHLLDWQTWLDEGIVDLVVPRAYVGHKQRLAPRIADWLPAMRESGQIALALSVYRVDKESLGPKSPKKIGSEIAEALAKGAAGIILFDLGRASDALLEALATAAPAPGPGPD